MRQLSRDLRLCPAGDLIWAGEFGDLVCAASEPRLLRGVALGSSISLWWV